MKTALDVLEEMTDEEFEKFKEDIEHEDYKKLIKKYDKTIIEAALGPNKRREDDKEKRRKG